MIQLGDAEKQKLLEQLLNSAELHDSPRYQDLLKYLVEKSLKGGTLKEVEIAQEFFGKDAKFDSTTDTTIRSYVSNLRKKLEHYYLTTDDKYSYVIEIPKGQYLIKFSQKHSSASFARNRPISHRGYIAIIGVLLIVILFQVVYHSMKNNILPTNQNVHSLWTEFLQQGSRPTLIVIGDYLFLNEKTKLQDRIFLRDSQINSAKDFNQAVRQFPQKYQNYELSDISYVGVGASLGVKDIFRMFGSSYENLSVKLSSQIKWDDFENNNIIFVGSLKNLYMLDTVFSRTHIHYNLTPNRLSVFMDSSKSYQSFDLSWRGGNYQKDFSIVVKLLGSNNNTILFLTGFSELGIMESVKLVTDADLSKNIENSLKRNLPQLPTYFEIISETEGVHYTVFRSSFKYFHSLTESLK